MPFASVPTTRQTQIPQVLKDELQNVTHKEVHYIPKEQYDFSNLYIQKPGVYV